MTYKVNGKLAKWIVGQIQLTINHTKTTLYQLGFANSRHKRAPFGFIGSISSTLFGTVNEHKHLKYRYT